MIDARCRELRAPGRTMLGGPQERWLARGLSVGPERWHFIAQQTLMAGAAVSVDGRRRFSSDAWDGYAAARDRLFSWITDNGLRSCVVLSGDAHSTFVSDLKRDFGDRDAPPIATEVCVTSITTHGRAQRRTDALVRENPHIHYGDSARRGYMVVEVTAGGCSAEVRVVADAADRRAAIETAAAFRIAAGRPGAQRA